MLEALFIPMFLAGLVYMLKPGPYVLAMSSLALDGRWKSMVVFWVSSMISGTFAYLLLLTGISFLPDKFGIIFIFLKAIAAIFFVIMGVNGLMRSNDIDLSNAAETKEKMTKQSFWESFNSGFMISLSNPYNIIFVIAVVPTIVNQFSFNVIDVLIIRLAVAASNAVVVIAYCTPILLIRKLIPQSFLAWIKIISSIAMLLIAAYIFFSMLSQWDLEQVGLLGQLKQWILYA
jgi:threonine/homoserine/homoserine lactone efflux protein